MFGPNLVPQQEARGGAGDEVELCFGGRIRAGVGEAAEELGGASGVGAVGEAVEWSYGTGEVGLCAGVSEARGEALADVEGLYAELWQRQSGGFIA